MKASVPDSLLVTYNSGAVCVVVRFVETGRDPMKVMMMKVTFMDRKLIESQRPANPHYMRCGNSIRHKASKLLSLYANGTIIVCVFVCLMGFQLERVKVSQQNISSVISTMGLQDKC